MKLHVGTLVVVAFTCLPAFVGCYRVDIAAGVQKELNSTKQKGLHSRKKGNWPGKNFRAAGGRLRFPWMKPAAGYMATGPFTVSKIPVVVETISVPSLTESLYGNMPNVGTILGVWNMVVSIVDIVARFEDFNAIGKVKMVGDVMSDLQSLWVIHDLIKTKLGLKHQEYACDNCTADEIDLNYRFTRTTFARRNFETANDAECTHELKNMIAVMRHALKKMEAASASMVEKLAASTAAFDGNRFHVDDSESGVFDLGLGCDGENLDPSVLEEFHKPSEFVDGHCRELPGLSASEAQMACVRKCVDEPDCAGFTWLDGKDDDEIDGNRCCFRTDVSNRYKQENTACFVASRARMLMLDSAGVGQWLDARGFGAYRMSAEKLKFNGLILSAITKPKLKQYLNQECRIMRQEFAESYAELRAVQGALVLSKGAAAPLSKAEVQALAQALKGKKAVTYEELDALLRTEYLTQAEIQARWDVMEKVEGAECGILGNDEASLLKCAIDVELVGVPTSGCQAQSVIKRYKEALGVVEPYVFWGLKTARGKYWSFDWLTFATARLAKQAAARLPSPYAAKVANDVAGQITVMMLFKKCYDNTKTLYEQAMCTAVFNTMAVANAAAFLYRQTLEATWDSCPKVRSLLMEQNIWKHVDKYVQEPMEKVSLQEPDSEPENEAPAPSVSGSVELMTYDKLVGNGWCRPSGCDAAADVTCRTSGFWKSGSSSTECESMCAATAGCIGFAISSPNSPVPNTCIVHASAHSGGDVPSGWSAYAQKYHDIATASGASEVKCYAKAKVLSNPRAIP